MARMASGLKFTAFKLSPTTFRRMEDIAHEMRKKNVFPGMQGKVTRTDVLRYCVNTIYDQIDREAKRLIETLDKVENPAPKTPKKKPTKKGNGNGKATNGKRSDKSKPRTRVPSTASHQPSQG